MKLLLEMGSVSSAKQKYKENLDIVDYFTQKDLSSNKRYVLKMCDLFFDEGIDTEKIVHLFAAYEDNKEIFDSCGVDFNRYSYPELFNLVFRGTDEYENNMSLPNEIYKSENGIITVGIIKTFQEAMNLENKNSWCTSVSQGRFEENTSNGTMLYIIRDIEFSKASECRFVVCQLFINGEKIYWTSGNKQLTNKHNGSIPSINEYENVIGEALEYLKPSTQLTNESKLNKNMNTKKTITESQLRNIIAESVKKVLKEAYNPQNEWGYYNYQEDDLLNEGNDKSNYRDEVIEIAQRLGWLSSYLHNEGILEKDDELLVDAQKAKNASDIVATILSSRPYTPSFLRDRENRRIN